MEGLFLPLLLSLTAAAALVAGTRLFGLPRAGIAAALGRAVEWAGLTALVAAVNVACGFALVLALRRLTGAFVSLYLNTDLTLLALSALQAAVLQWWMEAAERD